MDGAKSRKSDAAATRKRRSSILKSQRPPRTPFSELEFNVATPTDAKSRRVSFSRQNGVAEFEITEATTAWKNVYVEHHKSLESSVNDSDSKGERPLVGHLGSRIADLNFEDAEAELVNTSSDQLVTSLSVHNEHTHDDKSLSAPYRNFELSEFTDLKTNQLFDDDANPVLKEATNQIALNFSVAPLAKFEESYLDVDFNATHISLKAGESVSDMSITDTIHSPEVAASKTNCYEKVDIWVVDKENIAVNPYVAPLPSENFAVADDCNDVLVFDGKKCKFQSDLKSEDLADPVDIPYPVTTSKRQTIVYDDNTGDISVTDVVAAQIIPHANDLNTTSRKMSNTVYGHGSNISMTQAVPSNLIIMPDPVTTSKIRTTAYNDDAGDISVTEAVAAQIILPTHDLNTTSRKISNTVYGDGSNISMTQAVPSNLIIMPDSVTTSKRRTTAYNDDAGDISVTEAVATQIILPTQDLNTTSLKMGNTVYGNGSNISMTQAVSSNLIIMPDPVTTSKRRTIAYNDDAGDISVTEAVAAQIILPTQDLNTTSRKMSNTVFGDRSNISMTQAVPSNVIISNDQFKKQDKQVSHYFHDLSDMSVTKAVPSIVSVKNEEHIKTIVYQNDEGLSMTEAVPANIIVREVLERRKTITYQNDEGDISLTQAVPINFLESKKHVPEKKKTMVYESDATKLEMTRAVPENLLLANSSVKRKTILFSNDDGNMSVTQAVPTHVMSLNDTHPDKHRHHVTCEKDTDDIPFTIGSRDFSLQELHGKVKHNQENIVADVTRLCSEALSPRQHVMAATSKRGTIVFNDDQAHISITQALPVNILEPVRSVFDKKKSIISEGTAADISITQAVPFDFINKSSFVNDVTKNEVMPDCNVTLLTVAADRSVNKTILHDVPILHIHSSPPNIKGDDSVAVIIHTESHDHANKSITQATSNVSNKNISISKDDLCNVAIANPMPFQMITIENDLAEKTKLVKDVVQNEMYTASLDLTIPGPQNVIVYEAAIKLDKTNEVTERNPAESVSNQTFISIIGNNGEANTEPMEKEEHSNDSTESIVNVRDDPSMEQVKENDNPDIDQTSILDDLLDMSNASMECEYADKKASMNAGSDPSFGDVSLGKNGSKESYLIIKEDVETSETDKSALKNESPPVEFDKPHTILGEIQQKLGHLKSFINIKNTKPKQIKCLNLQNITEHEKPLETNPPIPKANKTSSNADDTNALLDMISDFTDTRRTSRDFTCEDDVQAAPVDYNAHIAIEDKSGGNAVRRSVVPDRRSMVRSREDLMKDISMAQAMLQNETTEESDDSAEAPSPVHARHVVVKTLKFDDDDSLRPEPDTPLKKTAFGETTYMHDSKTKVIPDYLSCASDLKDLMDDLVKPMADMVPFSGAPARSASTCSTEIQANLLNSSQIDLEVDADADACSTDISNGAISLALENEMLHNEDSTVNVPPLVNRTDDRSRRSSGRVIVFDHYNPLNNVLLPAIDAGEVHGYDPSVSATSSRVSELGAAQRDVESRVAVLRLALPPGDLTRHRAAAPRSTDRDINAACLDLKDSEVNTLITMKKNNELLDASSSLTLVDDTMQSPFEIADSDSPSPPKVPSPVKVIYKTLTKDDSSLKLDTDLTSAEDDIFLTQAKKRVYSPANLEKKQCTFAHEVTPKPASKVKRISNSPQGCKSPLADPSMDATSEDTSSQDALDQPHQRRSRASRIKSPDSLTIHHLVTEYAMDAMVEQRALAIPNSEALDSVAKSENSLSTEPATEDNSEKAAKSLDALSAGSSLKQPQRSGSGGSGWQPELLHEMNSKNLADECDSSANVVAKIDVLPFMGTSECEWEARGADAWSLRLLRGRVRLALRLRHRHDNAPRTSVRADTPVLAVAVEPVADPSDEEPIAALCVRFACAAMRRCAEPCARAGHAPALLRRCAAVARAAARWARAMHAARAHLAFSLAHGGALSLKVANIPLRSVWEVTMRVEMSPEDGDAPRPLATEVRVERVVSELPIDATEIARVLAPVPRDWGHAPRVIWKIFKHLKRRTRDDDILMS